MSHPFGDLVWQHLIRKRGLSQNKLAMGINQDPAVIARMCNGRALTGPQSRERVVQIIEWLHEQGVLHYIEEANALLAAADKPPLTADQRSEAQLLQRLKGRGSGASGSLALSVATTEKEEEIPVTSGPQPIPPCPYRGLFAFREEDAPCFFGRETFTTKLVEAVQVERKPLVAVIGPSGSGKSSVVFAGLVPYLRRAGIWLVSSFRPVDRPFHSLAASLIPLLEPGLSETARLVEINRLAEGLRNSDVSLHDVARRILEKESDVQHLLLVADQFEELYTLCRDASERQRFIDTLLLALMESRVKPSLSAVITLRADFLGRVLSYRPMVDALQSADLKLGPMTTKELQEAIERPARQMGVRIEDGLTTRILNAVNDEPGCLPLLEFALTLLWARQTNGKLTHTAYDEMGGVEKALAGYAEEVYGELSEVEKRKAQHVFLQLVRPGEGTEDTRRMASRAEVGKDKWDLVTQLANSRLVVTGREGTPSAEKADESTEEDTVEVVHEALISGWERLRQWVESDREFRTWQERLRAAMRQWEATSQDEGASLRGAPLVEAEQWIDRRQADLSTNEQDYIRSSITLRERERAAREQERMMRERTRRWITIGALVGLLIAVVLALSAESNSVEAQKQQQIARSRELAAKASSQLLVDPDLSLLLAIEAVRAAHTSQAEDILRKAMAEPHPRLVLHHAGPVSGAVFSPDGQYIVTGSSDGTAKIWDALTGEEHLTLRTPSIIVTTNVITGASSVSTIATEDVPVVATATGGISQTIPDAVRHVALSPDGKMLVTSGDTLGSVRIWDFATGYERLGLHVPSEVLTAKYENGAYPDRITSVEYSPDGYTIATAGEDGMIRLWDPSTGEQKGMLDAHPTSEHFDLVKVRSLAFSPDGRRIAANIELSTIISREGNQNTYTAQGMLTVWEIDSGEKHLSIGPDGNLLARYSDSIVYSPDGRYIIAYDDSLNGLAIFDADSGDKKSALTNSGRGVFSPVNGPGGQSLVTIDGDSATVWTGISRSRKVLTLRGHGGQTNSAAYSPDGQFIVTADNDGTAKVWDAWIGDERGTLLPHTEQIATASYSPDGRFIVGIAYDARDLVKVWDAATGAEYLRLAGDTSRVTDARYSPDGQFIVTTSRDKTATIWDARSGQQRLILRASAEIS